MVTVLVGVLAALTKRNLAQVSKCLCVLSRTQSADCPVDHSFIELSICSVLPIHHRCSCCCHTVGLNACGNAHLHVLAWLVLLYGSLTGNTTA